MNPWNEITIQDMQGFTVGNAEYEEAATGCTVILPKGKAVTGVDIRGGGPASRESALLNPLSANDGIHALLLSGGSAFGLSAADGVMQWLEEKGIGFPTMAGVVPIVCASCLFDLEVQTSLIRPDAALGRTACENAGNFQEGNHGAGTGATIGKLMGPAHMMKSGIGSYCMQIGELQIGAIVAVNALGNVYEKGTCIAGMQKEGVLIEPESVLVSLAQKPVDVFNGNTTIGAILTNAAFNKTEMSKIASMANDGYARAIQPVHTMFDGDSIYALSNGDVKADLNIVGSLAALCMERAIVSAVKNAESAYGLKAYKEMNHD